MTLEPVGKAYRFKLGEDDVFIGDPTLSEFKPLIKLTRWNNENSLKIIFNDAVIKGSKTILLEDNKVKFQTKVLNLHFYQLSPTTQYEHGGVEFEIILKEKPTNNIIALPIESNNLKFLYQAPLTELYTIGETYLGAIITNVTETYVATNHPNVDISRPENVVGSYAVYHINKRNNKYKAGKAFHIFRPKAIDSDGWEVWGTIHIENGILTITLPQNFLDNANYPISIDPTFGKTTIGGTNGSHADNDYIFVSDATATEDGTATQISACLFDNVTPYDNCNGRGCFYDDSAGEPNNLEAAGSEQTITDQPNTWNHWTISQAFSAGQKYVGFAVDEAFKAYWDDNSESTHYSDGDYPPPSTFPSHNHLDRIYSAYVTYTPQVAKAGTDTSTSGNSMTLSWSHTLVAGSNRMVVVYVGAENADTIDVSGITYGGEAMTKAVDHITGESGLRNLIEIWYILEADLPSDGSKTVIVTFSGTADSLENQGFCAEYTGVKQEASEETDGNNTIGTFISNTIYPSINSWCLSAVHSSSAAGFTHGQGQTEVHEFQDSTSTLAVAELRGGAGEVSLDSTFAGPSSRLCRCVASFKFYGASDINKAGIDTSSSGDAATLNFSHTLVAGSNRLVVVFIAVEHNAAIDVSSVTYGGETMTKAAEVITGESGWRNLGEVWYILEADLPSDGSKTVAITFSAAAENHAYCAEYTGVNQGAPEETDAVAELTPPDETIENSITPSSKAWVFSMCETGAAGGSWTHGEKQTEIHDFMDGSSTFGVCELKGAEGTETSLSSTYSTTPTRLLRIAVSWKEVTGVETYTKGYAADALLLGVSEKGYAADVLVIQPNIEKAYAADVLVKAIETKGYPADVLLKGPATKDYAADTLVVQPDIEKPYAADTILIGVVSKGYPADVLLKGTSNKPYPADTLVKGSTDKNYLADVLLKGVTTKPYLADTLVKAIVPKDYLADTILLGVTTKGYPADVLLLATDTKGYPADVIVVGQVTKDYAADVLLLGTTSKGYQADVIVGIFDTYTKPYAADTLLKGPGTKDYAADVLVLESLSKPYLADTLLIGTTAKPYAADVLLKGTTPKNYLADVLLKATESIPYPADVLIQQPDIPKDYPADVLLKGTTAIPYVADLLVKGEGVKSYQADVIVGPVVPPPHVAVNLYASVGTVDLRASSGKVNLYAREKEEVELV